MQVSRSRTSVKVFCVRSNTNITYNISRSCNKQLCILLFLIRTDNILQINVITISSNRTRVATVHTWLENLKTIT